MANSYSAPNFNIDTSTNVAGLTGLKGSAPALTDHIYIYNGATLTVESSLSILKIWLGQTSGGAAGAGNRYGLLTQNAGVKITFAGNTTPANSGIQSNPTSADTSSKGSKWTVNGTSGSHAITTNDGEARDTNKRYRFQFYYGIVDIDYLDINWHYDQLFYQLALDATKTDATTQKVNHVTVTENWDSGYQIISVYAPSAWDVNLEARFLTLVGTSATSAPFSCYCNNNTLGSGVTLDFSGYSYSFGNAYVAPYPPVMGLDQDQYYFFGPRIAETDIRPTELTPTTPAAADAGTSGELNITWANGASYRDVEDGDPVTDFVYCYNNAGGAILGIFKAKDGAGTITGLTNGTEYTMYLKATSDGVILSAATGTFTGTPAAAPSASTFTVAEDGDGTNFTVTITGDAGVTNYVRYRAPGATTWTDGGSRAGDGTVQVGAGPGQYDVSVYPVNAGGAGGPWADIKDVLVRPSKSWTDEAGAGGGGSWTHET